jgi:hypothetical protein
MQIVQNVFVSSISHCLLILDKFAFKIHMNYDGSNKNWILAIVSTVVGD